MAESIKTLKASGGDYTSIQTWWDTECANYDCVTNATSPVLECYNDWSPAKSEDCIFTAGGGYAASATHHPIIRAASGERHDGTPDTGFKLTNATINYDVIKITSANYLEINGLEIGTYSSYGWRNCIKILDSTTGVSIENCIIGHHSGAISGSIGIATPYATTYDLTIKGNLFTGYTGIWSGYKGRLATAGAVQSNVFATSTLGIDAYTTGSTTTTTMSLQNNVFYGCTTDVNVAVNFSSPSNNATSNASGLPGTSNVYDVVSGDFVDAANDDYHLSAASQLIDAGANLYTDGSDVDVDGDVWPNSAWDIGFDRYVASGGGGISAALTSTLDNATLSADGELSAQAELSIAFDGIGLSSSTGIAVSATASNTLSDVVLSADGTIISGLQANSDISLSDVSLSSDGAISVLTDLSVTLGDLSLSADVGIYILADSANVLTDVTLSADGTVISGRVLNLDAALDAASLTSDGAVSVQAAAVSVLSDLGLSADASLSIVADVSDVLDSLQLSSDGTAGAYIASLDVTLDEIGISSDATLGAIVARVLKARISHREYPSRPRQTNARRH